ncbi:putative glycerol kinase 5 [Trichogramma pretiosum]|uniref:putative glycerol kinase 5 n=1 Tax=Trichogramma pretiosum TaxID=7493 RepID=UPI0006C9B70C|nr:putative glycerol kinase 5 [Trichogramma pretiosum]
MRYIAALDVGTTTIRCHILDEKGQTVAAASEKVKLLYPQAGYVEIDPDWLWNAVLRVVQQSLKESGLKASQIETLGISTQRCTLITWNAETGVPYHNFITWKDLRAKDLVSEWNRSFTMGALRLGAKILYRLSRNKRYLAASCLQFMNTQMTLRLVWALENIDGLRKDAENGKAVFGGVDSWLLYKMTGRHVMDVSSASATGLYDPFTMEWGVWAQKLFNLPVTIFPKVVDTSGDFGNATAELFGVEVPIGCSMADQSASLYGSACTKFGDIKLTMGTGSFLNVNTGDELRVSLSGLYPLLGWKIGSEKAYIFEGASNDTGAVIEWAGYAEFIRKPGDLFDLANSVKDSDGVYFIPAFSGLQAPFNNPKAAAGFIGIKPTTEVAHVFRSMLESLVFRVLQIFETIERETKLSFKTIKVDGGVSNNEFVMQLLADLTGVEVERSTSTEMSILGTAFLAGLHQGIWSDKEDITKLRKVERVFVPNKEVRAVYENVYRDWKMAVQRFIDWY